MRRLLFVLLVLSSASAAASIEYRISGVDEPLRANVLAYVKGIELGRRARVSDSDLDVILQDSISQARDALRPYGFYQPEIRGNYFRTAAGDPVIELRVDAGQAVAVSSVRIAIEGEGAGAEILQQWRRDWPLAVGQRLDQVVYESQKQAALRAAVDNGYLAAAWSTHAIRLDLEDQSAEIDLTLQTGPRYVVGEIDYGEHELRPGVVENVPRFEVGDPFTARLANTFRLDLWKTGYFTDVNVTEHRRDDAEPPAVDMTARLQTAHKNRYLGALGFGTDTGVRLQGNWTRQPMSSRGDRLDIGLGWQEVDDEVAARLTYRVPRLQRARQYWTADLTLKIENQDLEFKRQDEDENFIRIANGDLDERHLRFGHLRVINRKSGDQQLSITTFAQFLNSDRRFDPLEPQPTVLDPQGSATYNRLLNAIDNTLSLGIDADLVVVRGKSFDTQGRRERAWLFSSSQALGSEFDFTQAYLSSRRSYLLGDNWKLLLRGEVGYTAATVDEVAVAIDGEPLVLSVTRLPNFYRFRAGGGASVRGYAFEQLSNNNVGSNHIATASIEAEYRLLPDWSIAAFADIGNAFNDWDEAELKLGVGLGVRWYSIAGPIRVDFARAMDFEGKPWRVHFTIGTPLL